MNQIETAVKYCQNKDLECLMQIVPKTVDPNALIFLWENNGMTIKQGSFLEIAAYCGATECVKYLLDVKAEVDKRDEILYKFITKFFIILQNTALYGLYEWVFRDYTNSC